MKHLADLLLLRSRSPPRPKERLDPRLNIVLDSQREYWDCPQLKRYTNDKETSDVVRGYLRFSADHRSSCTDGNSSLTLACQGGQAGLSRLDLALW